MSSVAEASDVVCANCGIAGVDNIKLEDCDGCDFVKYCGDGCREDHREKHEEECQKRAVILHDKKLLTQPKETHLGECPLCFLPMPLDPTKTTFYSCCSKTICYGCKYADDMKNGGDRCPFCREPLPDDDDNEENTKRKMNRIKANDPAAMRNVGNRLYQEGDYDGANKYWTKAAELGDVGAHCQMGTIYYNGEGVEKDEVKAVYHSEQAAIGGHPKARYNLGAIESRNGNMNRSVKHFIIAANLGYDDSMKALWKHYSKGNITKEELDATLRTHHAAINEMKSPEREAAEKAWS